MSKPKIVQLNSQKTKALQLLSGPEHTEIHLDAHLFLHYNGSTYVGYSYWNPDVYWLNGVLLSERASGIPLHTTLELLCSGGRLDPAASIGGWRTLTLAPFEAACGDGPRTGRSYAPSRPHQVSCGATSTETAMFSTEGSWRIYYDYRGFQRHHVVVRAATAHRRATPMLSVTAAPTSGPRLTLPCLQCRPRTSCYGCTYLLTVLTAHSLLAGPRGRAYTVSAKG